MKNIPFIKYQGLGNDYIYINTIDNEVNHPQELAKKISHRNFGVGADGLILVQKSVKADYKMRIFNADGSEAEMCGNGIRGFAKYLYDYGFTKSKTLTIETLAGIKNIIIETKRNKADQITVDMGEPQLERSLIPMLGDEGKVINESIELEDAVRFDITAISMGNPHAVIFVEDTENFPVTKYGPLVENHSLFPNRTNVEFIQIINDKEIIQRTWERGSGETLACGTGASAAVVAGNLIEKLSEKVTVHLKGGDLKIHWDKTSNHVFMKGPAVEVFKGKWPIRGK